MLLLLLSIALTRAMLVRVGVMLLRLLPGSSLRLLTLTLVRLMRRGLTSALPLPAAVLLGCRWRPAPAAAAGGGGGALAVAAAALLVTSAAVAAAAE